MNLADLPPEIFLEIIRCIDDLPDLLSLSLTTRTFYDVLVPTYTEYFEIRCTIEKADFWEHLRRNAYLCKSIRKLILVQYDWKTRLPKAFPTSGIEMSALVLAEGFRLLNLTLAQMSNLKTFRSAAMMAYQDTSSLLTALTQSKCVLEELKFGYPRHAYYVFPKMVRISNWDFDWSRLSHLSFLLNSVTIAEEVLSKVLTSCPRLTELCFLIAPGIEVSDILAEGRWPHLKRLTLSEMAGGGTYYTTDNHEHRTETLQSFFLRHPLLEVIRLPGEIYPSGFLMKLDVLLPNIKSFSFPPSGSAFPSFASKLKHIYAGRWDGSIFNHWPNLQSCIINGQLLSNNVYINLSEHIPNIERLYFWLGDCSSQLDEIRRSAQVCFHLNKLKTLFLGNFFFLDLTQESDQLLIDEICQAIPSLTYINIFLDGQPSLIRLTRDPVTYAYQGFQYVSPMPSLSEINEEWGEFLFYSSKIE